MLRFSFISKRNAALSAGPNYTRCSYDTETVVAFKPRSSNGIHCVSFVAFSKVSTLDSVFEVKRFHAFSCVY